jgi:hypothetical protein
MYNEARTVQYSRFNKVLVEMAESEPHCSGRVVRTLTVPVQAETHIAEVVQQGHRARATLDH